MYTCAPSLKRKDKKQTKHGLLLQGKTEAERLTNLTWVGQGVPSDVLGSRMGKRLSCTWEKWLLVGGGGAWTLMVAVLPPGSSPGSLQASPLWADVSAPPTGGGCGRAGSWDWVFNSLKVEASHHLLPLGYRRPWGSRAGFLKGGQDSSPGVGAASRHSSPGLGNPTPHPHLKQETCTLHWRLEVLRRCQ